MSDTAHAPFSVAALFAERAKARHADQQAEEQLKRRQQEELDTFKARLESFEVTPAHVDAVYSRIRRAFERGETELMITSFPSDFCSDSGRAISNAGAPPITKPDPEKAPKDPDPDWLATLPAGGRRVYDYWKANMRPNGFTFSARIVDYPGGKPGDVGLFLGWPKDAPDV